MFRQGQNKQIQIAFDILYDIFGSILYAAGVCTFASAAEFAPGGIAGLAVILHHFLHVPIGVGMILMNIPVILLCYKTLGKAFLLKSFKTMAISAFIMDVVFPMIPVYQGDKLIAALFAGALTGVGLSLIYTRGSSTGGTDFLILSLQKKIPHMSVGSISMLTDGSVLILSWAAFGRVDAVLQGIVMTVICALVVDKMLYSFGAGKITVVITEKGEDIARDISSEVKRGVTIVKATGSYTGEARKMLMCACSKSESARVRGIVRRHDSSALILFCPMDEAYGLGFRD
ncbi:MAG TPA: YitT family protein [Clostridia bacterium]|nr:YitT family protein [Clostridia bacterium]